MGASMGLGPMALMPFRGAWQLNEPDPDPGHFEYLQPPQNR